MSVVGCESQRKKMVCEARYMCNGAKQQRYFTTAESKGQGQVTVTLDGVSLAACLTYGSISFTVVNHTGR